MLKLAVAWAGFYLLRACERLLPASVLGFLLWPIAAVRDLIELRGSELVASWRCFPESWRPRRAPYFLRQSLGLYHAQLISNWADRLGSARWLSRCRLEGGSDLIGSRVGNRGVVLASLHFGPSDILPCWLRAHGIVTTTIRALPYPDSLTSLTTYRDALSPPADVPFFLPVKALVPLPRFTSVRQFLGPGRRLLVEVDVNRGLQFQVPFEDRSFRMASGAARLAAMAGAELIPCLIVETGSWKFAIHFGTPVPQSYLGDSPDLPAVGAHLLGEFAKVITRYPEQCSSTLLSALSPLPGNEERGPSAGAHPAEAVGDS